ncbi:MAG: NAD(+)/NADH kinase [Chloroflexi bacterium]|nr:NAD(+)/NADH kinase [Chloroflexota bacterium]
MTGRVGVVYQPQHPAAQELAARVREIVAQEGQAVWAGSVWDVADLKANSVGLSLVVALGGDGTILRVGRVVAVHGVPLLGVNLGRLGFLSELEPGDVDAALPSYLRGDCWVEERTMVRATVRASADGPPTQSYDALNEVLVGRGGLSRIVRLSLSVDGAPYATYRADGLIVATPTGSTAYALAAGGPVLSPYVPALVLIPVAPHLSLARALVVPDQATVQVSLAADHQAVLSVDGQVDVPIDDGALVEISASPYRCRFLRRGERADFYRRLGEKLRHLRP